MILRSNFVGKLCKALVVGQEYIAEAIGQRFVESVPLNMETTWG
jgi:hypothetical protein